MAKRYKVCPWSTSWECFPDASLKGSYCAALFEVWQLGLTFTTCGWYRSCNSFAGSRIAKSRRLPGNYEVSWFLNHHPIFACKIASHIERHRAQADNQKVLAEFLQLLNTPRSKNAAPPIFTSSTLERTLDEHANEVYNIWNIDEKGFMLENAHKAHVIWTRAQQNAGLVQNGERKFVTVLEGVSAAGVLLLPLIIGKEVPHWISWHAYVTQNEGAYVAYSPKRWTDIQSVRCGVSGSGLCTTVCSSVGQQPHAGHEAHTDNANSATCRLMLDGHGCHVSIGFLIYAKTHNFVVISLDTHSRHLIQLLDVGLVGTLQCHHSALVDKLTSRGLTSTKRLEFYK